MLFETNNQLYVKLANTGPRRYWAPTVTPTVSNVEEAMPKLVLWAKFVPTVPVSLDVIPPRATRANKCAC